MEDIKLKFRLRLNIEEWGKYKKGDEDDFYMSVLDERNGLVRYPIDKHWDIVRVETFSDTHEALNINDVIECEHLNISSTNIFSPQICDDCGEAF